MHRVTDTGAGRRRRKSESDISMRVIEKRKFHLCQEEDSPPISTKFTDRSGGGSDTIMDHHRLHCSGSAHCPKCRIESGLSCNVHQYPVRSGTKFLHKTTAPQAVAAMSSCQSSQCHHHHPSTLTTTISSEYTNNYVTGDGETIYCKETEPWWSRWWNLRTKSHRFIPSLRVSGLSNNHSSRVFLVAKNHKISALLFYCIFFSLSLYLKF
jgi:hypothetical protein